MSDHARQSARITNPYEPSYVVQRDQSVRRMDELVLGLFVVPFGMVTGVVLYILTYEFMNRGWQSLPAMLPGFVLQLLIAILGVRVAWPGLCAPAVGHRLPQARKKVRVATGLLLIVTVIYGINMAIFSFLMS